MIVLTAFLLNTIFNFAIGLLVAYYLGPYQFGRFALALTVGLLIQGFFFEWIRFSAQRFLTGPARPEKAVIVATLNRAFAILVVVVAALGAGAILSGIEPPPSRMLFALAIAAAVGNGLFDYRSAVLRAQFLDRDYAWLMLVKNVLALLLTVGAAFLTGSAAMALAGACVAMGGSVVLAGRAWTRRPRFDGVDRAVALDCARYGAPIVAANILYVAITLTNRSLISDWYGYAENGFFSLAADTGSRLMAALGTALDALLFQLAVRADENAGRSAAQAQVARNMAIVFAALTPAAVGFWMVLPSLEALVAPSEFRGPFRHYLELLLPGLFFQGLAAFAVAAVFQIDKRTTPIVAAAALGCIVNAALMFTLPHGADGTMAAIAQSSAYVAAFLCLLGFAIFAGAQMPPLRDVALTIVGVVVMGAAIWPLRSWEPGVVTILAQVGLGGAVYVGVVLAFDVAGLRTALRSVLGGARRR